MNLNLNAAFLHDVDEEVKICPSLRWSSVPATDRDPRAGPLESPIASASSNASTPRIGSPLNAAGAVGVDAEENGAAPNVVCVSLSRLWM